MVCFWFFYANLNKKYILTYWSLFCVELTRVYSKSYLKTGTILTMGVRRFKICSFVFCI